MKVAERLQIEAERLEKLRGELERNPAMRKFREQEREETIVKRKAAAGRLAELDREAAVRIPALTADLAEKEAEQKAHEERGRVLAAATLAARAALSRARLDLDSERRGPEAELLESYDKRLDEAIEFHKKRLEHLREPGRIMNQATGGKRNVFTMKKVISFESNAEAVRAALAYSQGTIKTLEKMKLSAEYDAEAVEALKAGMPKIDTYERFKTEKNMERLSEPDNPLNIAAQEDARVDRLMKKLTDRVDKLLKTPTKKLTAPPTAPAPKAPAPATPATPKKPTRQAYLDDYKKLPGGRQYR